jgi:hypothetical protein
MPKFAVESVTMAHCTWSPHKHCGEWYWFDPDSDWPKDAPFRRPFELAPLDPL